MEYNVGDVSEKKKASKPKSLPWSYEVLLKSNGTEKLQKIWATSKLMKMNWNKYYLLEK